MSARARDLGIVVGSLPTGALNAITDVAGVRVGHTTLIEGDGPLVVGAGRCAPASRSSCPAPTIRGPSPPSPAATA